MLRLKVAFREDFLKIDHESGGRVIPRVALRPDGLRISGVFFDF